MVVGAPTWVRHSTGISIFHPDRLCLGRDFQSEAEEASVDSEQSFSKPAADNCSDQVHEEWEWKESIEGEEE